MRHKRNCNIIRLALALGGILLPLCGHSQNKIPVSVRELAPNFGIRPQFLDDTIHFVRYLDSLNGDNHAMTDSCVTLNAKLMAMENVLLYDYRHRNDTVWIDATHYLEDYKEYTQRLKSLSELALGRAHNYIEREHIRQDVIQTNALNLRKDTIDRYHRTIVNACEGIGVSDKSRKKELKDIYYAYLTVYNRYDLSMKRSDSAHLASLNQFCAFQKSIIDNLLGTNNYSARINNFANTLKVRCGHNHSDVLRSYQRVFRQPIQPPTFSTVDEYDLYIASLQNIISIQNAYITVVELREQIAATSRRITTLYSPKFRDAAKTYQEVADALNITPAFNTLPEGTLFIAQLREFMEVQDRYLQDFDRLRVIQQHSSDIMRSSTLKNSDIAKSYKLLCDVVSITPKYKTLDDADRFNEEMSHFQCLQRQYDTILALRHTIDSTQDSISRNWMSHLIVYNGYQNIRKHHILTPTFIDTAGGHQFIAQLLDYNEMQHSCLRAIRLHNQYRQLDSQLLPALQPYRNIRKAYSRLQGDYLNIKTINHLSELYQYIRQLEAIITVQEHLLQLSKTGDAANSTDLKLKNLKDSQHIETILGL